VKPSTSEHLPARLKELVGKLGWMKWEPPLAGCISEGRRSQRAQGYMLWVRAAVTQPEGERLCTLPNLPLTCFRWKPHRRGEEVTLLFLFLK